MDIDNIKDRITIRTSHIKGELQDLGRYLNESDSSKLIEFAFKTAVHHIKIVTELMVDPDYDVIFQRKRKSHKLKRRIY